MNVLAKRVRDYAITWYRVNRAPAASRAALLRSAMLDEPFVFVSELSRKTLIGYGLVWWQIRAWARVGVVRRIWVYPLGRFRDGTSSYMESDQKGPGRRIAYKLVNPEE